MTIFCSGIGGIGLSAYASLQRSAGHAVFGSDQTDSVLIGQLRDQGIQISLQQDGAAVPDHCDLFVYSEAIPADAPERKRAGELGIPQCSYFQALGDLSSSHRVLAVCGTHGKSSTTAMAARMLVDAGLDPTIVVGTMVPDLGGRNWRRGASDLFLVEACEYKRSFLHLSPSVIILTNADGDHFDTYASVEEYQKAFITFVESLPATGALVTHAGDPDCARIAHAAGHVPLDADREALPTLSIPGRHMQENAQLVLALARVLGVPDTDARASLQGYRGAWRRLERKGTTLHEIDVYDDYGHHPREIRATLDAVRSEYPSKRIVCAFQPHMHDRTRQLYDDFIRAFSAADVVIIAGIYNARSTSETAVVDCDRFVEDLARESGVDARNGLSLSQTEEMLRADILQKGDVLLVMGAGDVTQLASRMVS